MKLFWTRVRDARMKRFIGKKEKKKKKRKVSLTTSMIPLSGLLSLHIIVMVPL